MTIKPQRIVSFAIVVLFSAMAHAGGDVTSAEAVARPAQPQVKPQFKLSKAYSSAKTLKAKVKKTMISGIMGTSQYENGDVIIKGDRLRMELKGDNHTLQIFKDGELTAVTFPPEGFADQKIQVARFKVNKRAEAFQMITSLLKGKNFEQNFEIIQDKTTDGVQSLTMKPSKEEGPFTQVTVLIDQKKYEIQELSYMDNLENKVVYEFSALQFDEKIEDKVFDYKAPKGSQQSHF